LCSAHKKKNIEEYTRITPVLIPNPKRRSSFLNIVAMSDFISFEVNDISNNEHYQNVVNSSIAGKL
jgi:hypothetical protein